MSPEAAALLGATIATLSAVGGVAVKGFAESKAARHSARTDLYGRLTGHILSILRNSPGTASGESLTEMEALIELLATEDVRDSYDSFRRYWADAVREANETGELAAETWARVRKLGEGAIEEMRYELLPGRTRWR